MSQPVPLNANADRPVPIRYTPSVHMKMLRRPSLSDSFPNTSGPGHLPQQVHRAGRRCLGRGQGEVSDWVRTPVTELATVIDRPSRIHAVPSPSTMRV